MAESYEDKFKAELYKRYNHCKKVLIPKDEYFTMIEELKAAAIPGGQKIEVTVTSFPTLVMVNGKPRHPQSQGSVERANSDIKDMLVAWMGITKPMIGQLD